MRTRVRATVVGVWIIALALVAIATSAVYSTFIEKENAVEGALSDVVEAIDRLTDQAEYDACVDRLWAHNDGLATLQGISGSIDLLTDGGGGSVSQPFVWDFDGLKDAGWGIGLSIITPEDWETLCGPDPSP